MKDDQRRARDWRFTHAEKPTADIEPSDGLSSLVGLLPPQTIRAWRTISPLVPSQAYLSGGTALAAHVRHRVSRDLAFFTESPFDPEELATTLSRAGLFAPTMVETGTLNGIFEDAKVQFLDASSQRLLEKPTLFGGVRLASLSDISAAKLKVIQDRGALRDYFDLMILDGHIPTEEGLRLLVDKFQPIAPAGLIANVVRGLGYLGDVEDDPSLPVSRAQIEAFWSRRQPEVARRAL